MNFRNKFGLKEGPWINFKVGTGFIYIKQYYKGVNSLERPYRIDYYSENELLSKRRVVDTTWEYYANGTTLSKMVLHRSYDDLNRYITSWFEKEMFYENGNLKSYCRPKKTRELSFISELDSCTYYNETGIIER